MKNVYVMSNLRTNCSLKPAFLKVDQHTGGKTLICVIKHQKNNLLHSLQLSCIISLLKINLTLRILMIMCCIQYLIGRFWGRRNPEVEQKKYIVSEKETLKPCFPGMSRDINIPLIVVIMKLKYDDDGVNPHQCQTLCSSYTCIMSCRVVSCRAVNAIKY